MDEDVKTRSRKTIIAIKDIQKYLATNNLHTWYLFWIALFVVFLTVVQGVSVWDGDPWRPHSEHFSMSALRWSRELHRWAEEEHPAGERSALEDHFGHHYEDHHEDHPSKIEMVVRNHWQTNVIWLIFHLNFVLFASWLFKLVVSWTRQSYTITLMNMLMCVLSGVVLFVVIICWLYLFVWFFSAVTLFGLLAGILALFLEIAILQNIHEIREHNLYLSTEMTRMYQQDMISVHIGQARSVPPEDEKLMRDLVCQPYRLFNEIMAFMCMFPQQLLAQQQQHRKTD